MGDHIGYLIMEIRCKQILEERIRYKLTLCVLAETPQQAGRNGKAPGKSITVSGVIHKRAVSGKGGENGSISTSWRITNGCCYRGGAGAEERGMGGGRENGVRIE